MGEISEEKKNVLRRLYEDPKHPGSFSGSRNLYTAAKAIYPAITQKDVDLFLRTSRAYTLHRLQPKRFRRRSILSPKPRVILAADIADMRHLARYNEGFKYLLVCIDAFSRFATALPLRRKDASSVLSAFKHILRNEGDFEGVSRLFVDRGKEFYNSLLHKYLREKKISIYSVHSQETKSSQAERFIRTIKSRLYRYMTTDNSLTYVRALDDIIYSYNNTKHKTLDNTPAEVHKMKRPSDIIRQFIIINYKKGIKKRERNSSVLTVGQYVRLVGAKRSDKFSRGFNIQNTEEIFQIDSVDKKQYPAVYTVRDLSGERVEGVFYKEELVKVVLPDSFPIIVKKKRVVKGKTQYLVSWVGYNQTSWVDAKDIVNEA